MNQSSEWNEKTYVVELSSVEYNPASVVESKTYVASLSDRYSALSLVRKSKFYRWVHENAN